MSSSTANKAVESSVQEWLVIIPDREGSDKQRPKLGKQHVDDMRPERGTRWLLGGMMLDEKDLTNGMKKVVGNVIIARAGSREELLEALRNDVYASDGVWDMEKIQIVPFESLFRLGLGF